MELSKFTKDKRVLALAAVVFVLIVAGTGFFVLHSRQAKPADFSNPNGDNSAPAVGTITAKELGLAITVRDDNKAVKFKINNAKDIKHVDYEIIYTHILQGQPVQEGITGEMNIAQDGITVTDYRPFGTCSSGVCRYDVGVSDVQLVMKVEKTDGKVYSLQQNIPIKTDNSAKTTGPESAEDQ